MTWSARSVATALFVALPHFAFAEVRNFQLSQVGGRWQCDAAQSNPAGDQGKVTVVLAAPPGAPLTDWLLSYTAKDGSAATEKFAVSAPLQASLQLANLKADSTLTAKGKVAGADVSCAEFKLASQDSGTTPPADTSLDQAARIWFVSEAGQAAEASLQAGLSTRLMVKRLALLSHLPSGAPAAPFPASLPENVDLQIALIVDKTETKLRNPRVAVESCPEREGLRILGNLAGVTGAGQSNALRTAPEFTLLPIGQMLQCGAGDAKYTMQMQIDGTNAGEPTTVQLKLRPIYQLAATGTWGFDSANTQAWSAVDGKVAKSESRLGSQVYFGFIWYPTGIDYDHVTRANRAAPFLFFDPTAPKDHLIAGFAITAKGRISIPIGISAHRIPVPKNGLTENSPFTGDGDVPVEPDWRKEGLGFFMGVAFNVADFARVKAAAAPGK